MEEGATSRKMGWPNSRTNYSDTLRRRYRIKKGAVIRLLSLYYYIATTNKLNQTSAFP